MVFLVTFFLRYNKKEIQYQDIAIHNLILSLASLSHCFYQKAAQLYISLMFKLVAVPKEVFGWLSVQSNITEWINNILKIVTQDIDTQSSSWEKVQWNYELKSFKIWRWPSRWQEICDMDIEIGSFIYFILEKGRLYPFVNALQKELLVSLLTYNFQTNTS